MKILQIYGWTSTLQYKELLSEIYIGDIAAAESVSIAAWIKTCSSTTSHSEKFIFQMIGHIPSTLENLLDMADKENEISPFSCKENLESL